MITSYQHMTYKKVTEFGKIVDDDFIMSWLIGYDQQRRYDDIDCYPDTSLCPANIFNTWTPFAMQVVTEWTDMPDALAMFRKHILILCGNETIVADYIEKWIGQMLQYPAVKTICPTFISKQGAGKSMFMNLISKMIGENKYFETSSPSRDVWGNFNGRMANKFFVNLDELSRKESLECEGKIKALITNPRLTINDKNISQYEITSYHRFGGSSNLGDPLQTSKDDRRNLIVNSSDELIGNKGYFNIMAQYLDDINAVKTCYEYFMSIPDLDKFGSIPMPQTEYQNDMKELSVSPIESWLKSYVLENYYETATELLDKDQYKLFTDWCNKCGIEYKLTSLQFGVRMKRLNINGILMGKHTKNGNTKIFNIEKLKKHFQLTGIVVETQDHDDD